MNDDWMTEHSFWFKKANAAFIRFNAAYEAGDRVAQNIAAKQAELYQRRMLAVVPPEARARFERKKQEEIHRAMKETL